MAKRKSRKSTLPKQVFVYNDNDDGEDCLIVAGDLADDDLAFVDDGQKVGVYQLVAIKTKRVTHVLE